MRQGNKESAWADAAGGIATSGKHLPLRSPSDLRPATRVTGHAADANDLADQNLARTVRVMSRAAAARRPAIRCVVPAPARFPSTLFSRRVEGKLCDCDRRTRRSIANPIQSIARVVI